MSTVGWGQRDDHAIGQRDVHAASGPAPEAALLSETPRTTASLGMWPFVELLRRNRVPLERVCEQTSVTPEQLRDPEVRFTQSTVNRIVGLAFELVGPTAAVAAAFTVEAGHFQLLELIARSAPTVGDGLEQFCRFLPLLHDGGRLVHELDADGAHALRWCPPSGYAVHHGCLELMFAVGLLGLRRETGRQSFAPIAVSFQHPQPPDLTLHQSVFGPGVQFGASEGRVLFDRAAAAVRLTRSNSVVHTTAVRAAADTIED